MSLEGSRILITNDDGINAKGIKVLEEIAKTFSKDIWIVAPETEQSATGHSLTITSPLRIRKTGRQKFAINGTPTDSVLLGIKKIITGKAPDIILSGINAGANLGDDITYSGTVAAAMEGVLLGIPAIALSQSRVNGQNVRWMAAKKYAPSIIKKLVSEGWARNVLMNVNFPNLSLSEVSSVEITVQGRRKIGGSIVTGRDPRGHDFVWIGTERNEDISYKGSDLNAISEGRISITPLGLDLTHRKSIKRLNKLF